MPVLDVTVAGTYLGTWNLDEIEVQDGVAMKAASGMDLVDIDRGLVTLNPVAWQVVVWHLRRQTDRKLRIGDVTFRMGEIDAEVIREGDPEVPSEAEAAKGETSANADSTSSTSLPAGSASPPRRSTGSHSGTSTGSPARSKRKPR